MENKKNRNKRLAIIAAMLALIVLILCLGGTTFAKYISSKTYEAKNVTVAKWGFVISEDHSKMFSEQYSDGAVVASGADGIDIQAKTLTVAPGAKGSMTFGVTGTAEVLAKLKVEADGKDVVLAYKATDADASTEASTYYPIKWTLNDGKTDVVDGGHLSTVIEKLNALSADLAIGDEAELSYTLSWEWAFEGQDDVLDTALGAYSANTTENATFTTTTTDAGNTTTVENTIVADETVITFNFSLKITVEQRQNTEPVTP